MKIYIYSPEHGPAMIVMAELAMGDYRVHHPENGYSVWPTEQFELRHRPLSRREAQLVNQSIAELEVMAISDPGPADQWPEETRQRLPADGPYLYNLINGDIELPDGRKS